MLSLILLVGGRGAIMTTHFLLLAININQYIYIPLHTNMFKFKFSNLYFILVKCIIKYTVFPPRLPSLVRRWKNESIGCPLERGAIVFEIMTVRTVHCSFCDLFVHASTYTYSTETDRLNHFLNCFFKFLSFESCSD